MTRSEDEDENNSEKEGVDELGEAERDIEGSESESAGREDNCLGEYSPDSLPRGC